MAQRQGRVFSCLGEYVFTSNALEMTKRSSAPGLTGALRYQGRSFRLDQNGQRS